MSSQTMNWFVVICAERTGSNLLVSMLDSHPQIGCAGEIFNARHLDQPLPWKPAALHAELVDLRRRDPQAMFERLGQIAAASGRTHFGFKLTYYHWMNNPAVVDCIKSTKGLRLIHLLRRNRLRRLLSNELARKTDVWKVPTGSKAPSTKGVKVSLNLMECLRDFEFIEQWESKVESTLQHAPTLRVYYEDMARDPQSVGSACLAHLGVENRPLALGFEKSGAEQLDDAIEGFEALREKMRTWASYFDD